MVALAVASALICATPARAAEPVTDYAGFKAALAEGGTITIGGPITADSDENVSIDTTVTLDLNGQTVTMGEANLVVVDGGAVTVVGTDASTLAGSFYLTGGSLDIQGGTITGSIGAPPVYTGSAAKDVDIKLSGGTVSAVQSSDEEVAFGLLVRGSEGTSVDIAGGTLLAEGQNAVGIALEHATDTSVSLSDGQISVEGDYASGIDIDTTDTTTVSMTGGLIQVTGGSGISAYNGASATTLEIAGGQIQTEGDYCDGISLYDTAGSTVNVTGGQIQTSGGNGIIAYGNAGATTLQISGGQIEAEGAMFAGITFEGTAGMNLTMSDGTVIGSTGISAQISNGDTLTIESGTVSSNATVDDLAQSDIGMTGYGLYVEYMDSSAEPVTIGKASGTGPELHGATAVADGKLVQRQPVFITGKSVETTFESCTLHPQVQRDDYTEANPEVYSDVTPFGNLFWILGEDYPSTYYVIQVGTPPSTAPATANDSYTIVARNAGSAQQAIDAIESGSAVVTNAPSGATATFTVKNPDVHLIVGEGVEGVKVEPAAPTSEALAVYRLYNPYEFLHIYTSDPVEKTKLEDDGWTVDFKGQPAWYAPAPGSDAADYEVVRLYNPFSHDHYFVPASDVTQIDGLVDLGWQRDSASSSIWSAAPEDGNVEVFTLFNPYNKVDTHLWTAQRSEVDNLVHPDGWELNTTTLWGVQPTE